MTRSVPLVGVTATNTAARAAEGEILVPSGNVVTFTEMLWDRPGSGLTYRFRFVGPDIVLPEGELDYELVERDMAHLCQDFASPRLSQTGPKPGQIVISIADRATEFGEPNPDATELFEAYSVQDNTCTWEPF